MNQPTTQPRERPILFNGAMVRALLAGTKTQTRRVVKITHRTPGLASCLEPPAGLKVRTALAAELFPHGKPGDRLWVREAWARTAVYQAACQEMVVYREGDNRTDYGGPWKPGIHMFRRDSRILLEITDVRVERLNDIGEADAQAEGVQPFTDFKTTGHWLRYRDGAANGYVDNPIASYASLWTEINGAGSWEANPWVWAVSFKVIAP